MALLSTIEWSKQVPSVQERSREPSDAVPHNYAVAVEDEHCNSSLRLQVPMVNMAHLVNAEIRQEELLKLRSACIEWGAFQLINFGVADELVKEMKRHSRDFFDLPLEEKQRYAQKEGGLEGYGQSYQPFIASEKKEWSDMMFVNALPVEDRDLNFWPENPRGFRETIDSYSKEMKRLAVSVLGFMGMALGLEAHEFAEVCEDGKIQVRMNYYPTCSQPEKFIGTPPHTDITSITFLLEFNETPGLQIQKDDCWITVKPVAGAILIIIGHIIEIMSNGIYRAPKHRAFVNESEERLSIVSFCYPGKNATIQPAHDLVKPYFPAIFISLSQPEYFHRFNNQKLDGDQFIDTLKVRRSP